VIPPHTTKASDQSSHGQCGATDFQQPTEAAGTDTMRIEIVVTGAAPRETQEGTRHRVSQYPHHVTIKEASYVFRHGINKTLLKRLLHGTLSADSTRATPLLASKSNAIAQFGDVPIPSKLSRLRCSLSSNPTCRHLDRAFD
jgi:hypothetical protein